MTQTAARTGEKKQKHTKWIIRGEKCNPCVINTLKAKVKYLKIKVLVHKKTKDDLKKRII